MRARRLDPVGARRQHLECGRLGEAALHLRHAGADGVARQPAAHEDDEPVQARDAVAAVGERVDVELELLTVARPGRPWRRQRSGAPRTDRGAPVLSAEALRDGRVLSGMDGRRRQPNGLTKRYGSDRGVVDLSFAVAQGEVFGYLGPNGAGKTTTIRLLLDLLRPTAGASRCFGLDPRRDGVAAPAPDRVPAGRPPPLRATHGARAPRATSRPCADARPAGDGEALAERLDARARPARSRALSKGNRQKVGLVQALLHRPGAARPRRADLGSRPARPAGVLRARRARRPPTGRTVFLSSHVLVRGPARRRSRRASSAKGASSSSSRVESLRAARAHAASR